MCQDVGAPECAAFAAANAVRQSDDSGVVVVALGTRDGSPVGFMIIDCIHDVELAVGGLRAAAEAAFKDQPCTKCDS